MNPSREKILRGLRARSLPLVDLPDGNGPWIEYADPLQQFQESLQSVGGACQRCRDREDLVARLRRLPQVLEARRVASLHAFTSELANLDWDAVASPHDLAQLDVLIAPGELAVAENGAVWVADQTSGLQAAYFLAEHLILLCATTHLVHNMHEAYQRIDATAKPFGVFVSGPSKTADIEQSLVIGAQGPRSLTVMLVDQFA